VSAVFVPWSTTEKIYAFSVDMCCIFGGKVAIKLNNNKQQQQLQETYLSRCNTHTPA